MTDPAHLETEEKLKQLEKRISQIYRVAAEEAEEILIDYLRRFETKDKTWRKWVKTGQKTEEEYKKWRIGQMAIGQRWQDVIDNLSADYHNANQIAKSVAYGYMPDIYAINHNYGAYEVEHLSEYDTNYTLYDRQTVENILRENPELLPQPGKQATERINAGLDKKWNKGQIQSVMMQGILQGLAIPKIAQKLAYEVGEKNRKAAIRNARTMTTCTQNRGRVDSYKRAQGMGIDLRQQWLATLDNRTRHAHRALDGQTVDVGDPFEVDGYKIRFPGDPEAPGYLIYNCRCTLVAQLKGFETDASDMSLRRNEKLGDMSYEEWKNAKSVYEDIEKQDKISKSSKDKYVDEYKGNSIAFTDSDKNAIADLRKKYENLQGAMLFGSQEEIKQFSELLTKERASAGQYQYDVSFNNQTIAESKLNSWHKEPTKQEHDAITTYARNGYVEMNRYLRQGDYIQPSLKQEAETLSSYLSQCETKEDLYLKRGVSISNVNKLFGDTFKNDPQSVIGNVFIDKGFTSTTPYQTGGFGGNVVEYIYAPKGTHGAYIKDYVVAKSEKEFLLDKGQAFIIRGVQVEVDKWEETHYNVFLEVINE